MTRCAPESGCARAPDRLASSVHCAGIGDRPAPRRVGVGPRIPCRLRRLLAVRGRDGRDQDAEEAAQDPGHGVTRNVAVPSGRYRRCGCRVPPRSRLRSVRLLLSVCLRVIPWPSCPERESDRADDTPNRVLCYPVRLPNHHAERRHEIPQERSQGIREEDAARRVDRAADHLHQGRPRRRGRQRREPRALHLEARTSPATTASATSASSGR